MEPIKYSIDGTAEVMTNPTHGQFYRVEDVAHYIEVAQWLKGLMKKRESGVIDEKEPEKEFVIFSHVPVYGSLVRLLEE